MCGVRAVLLVLVMLMSSSESFFSCTSALIGQTGLGNAASESQQDFPELSGVNEPCFEAVQGVRVQARGGGGVAAFPPQVLAVYLTFISLSI